MKNQVLATTRRIGAGFTIIVGIAELAMFYWLPAFDAYFFELTPYQVLRAGDLLDYQSSTCALLTALAIAGSLVCIGLSLLVLAVPESPDHGAVSFGISAGYTIGLFPYFILLITAATDSYFSGTVMYSSFFLYILCSIFALVGFSLLDAKAAPTDTPASPNSPQGTPASYPGTACQQLTLTRMNTQEHFPILSTSPDVILGRSSSDANIIVGGNGLIGRKHAKIGYQNGQFCITDLNSKNKSYLNDLCLQPNIPYALKQGDYVTLANEVFAVESIQ